jgi:uncharacterized membrane protein
MVVIWAGFFFFLVFCTVQRMVLNHAVRSGDVILLPSIDVIEIVLSSIPPGPDRRMVAELNCL